MAYTYSKVGWKDGTDGGTPVSAANLNKMDDGIAAAHDNIGDLSQLSTTATDSAVSAINEVAETASATSAELKANGNSFYFDYQNGKYGYNTDSARGADTFVPFNKGEISSYSGGSGSVSSSHCDGSSQCASSTSTLTLKSCTISDNVITLVHTLSTKEGDSYGSGSTKTTTVTTTIKLA